MKLKNASGINLHTLKNLKKKKSNTLIPVFITQDQHESVLFVRKTQKKN